MVDCCSFIMKVAAELHDLIVDDLRKMFPDLAAKARITVVEALPHILSM